MNMPAGSGNLVHQVIGEYPIESLEKLLAKIASEDFLIVKEYYNKRDPASGKQALEYHGKIALNPLHIGKIKEFEGSYSS
ncbi:MAG: hypothetical protein KGL39_38405 [Patescibacteria group bacterium]|nr:hypothetical protein [Patescibacteria group bacterium]